MYLEVIEEKNYETIAIEYFCISIFIADIKGNEKVIDSIT